MATPYGRILLDEVTSTQDLATAEVARTGLATLVVAARQTAGRGRGGNQWWQAPRGVAASLAFGVDVIEVDETFPLRVGLAVREAIQATTGVVVDLKWPNDIELHRNKVGGILVERDSARVAIGCGLNLWWPNPPDQVAGLVSAEPAAELGAAISDRWATQIMTADATWDVDRYVAACSTIGENLTWHPDGCGVATGIDEIGGLVVATANGSTTLRSGEIRMVRRVD